jgi:Sulfatase
VISAGAARALARCAFLPGVCFLLIVATQARLSRTLPSYELGLYAARLALVAALALSLYWFPVQLADLHCRGWRSAIAAGLSVVLALPAARSVAQHLALSDGLRAYGVTPAQAEPALLALLLAGPLCLWAYQRLARARAGDFALGLALFGALVGAELWIGRVQVDLSALLQAGCSLLIATLLELALRAQRGWTWRASAAGSTLVATLTVLSLLQPAAFARGRRRALVQESPLELVERRLWLAPAAAPLPPAPSAARCAQLLAPSALPRLLLDANARRNVILISIDTLRADYAGARVEGRPLMPGLLRFLGESRRAQHAHTGYPATLLALSSALRGLSVSELLLAPRLPASVFQAARPRLDALHAVLPRGNYFARPAVRRHLLAGLEPELASGARAQTDSAIARLRELRAEDRRHLLWIHYFEPHAPYRSWQGLEFGSSDRQRHLSELALVDRELTRLLALLREEGWYQDSLIVVFADHGESFGERGHRYHHNLVYPWLVRVPFALRVPGGAAGVIGGPVQLSDLAPTVLQFLGAAHAPHAMSGVPLLAGDPPAERLASSEEFAISGNVLERFARTPLASRRELEQRLSRIERGPGYPSKLALTSGRFALIAHRGSGVGELYDVAADPRAARDLADSAPGELAELQRAAAGLRERVLARALCQLQAARAQ